jgi:hypothetical protein
VCCGVIDWARLEARGFGRRCAAVPTVARPTPETPPSSPVAMGCRLAPSAADGPGVSLARRGHRRVRYRGSQTADRAGGVALPVDVLDRASPCKACATDSSAARSASGRPREQNRFHRMPGGCVHSLGKGPATPYVWCRLSARSHPACSTSQRSAGVRCLYGRGPARHMRRVWASGPGRESDPDRALVVFPRRGRRESGLSQVRGPGPFPSHRQAHRALSGDRVRAHAAVCPGTPSEVTTAQWGGATGSLSRAESRSPATVRHQS